MTESIEGAGTLPEGKGSAPFLAGFAEHAAAAARLLRDAQNNLPEDDARRPPMVAEAQVEATLAGAYAMAAVAARQG